MVVKDKVSMYQRAEQLSIRMYDNNITYTKMAKLTEYSWGHLWNSLNGERLPSAKLLAKVEQVLQELISDNSN